jgi:hypothetical protein
MSEPENEIDKPGRRAVFERIFRENYWGNGESVSGEGSNLERTAVIRSTLPGLMARHGVRSMLDAPCGDFFWMRETALTLDEYIGADIVPDIIAANLAQYASERNRFIVADLIEDALPRADLVFCRDCLVHLPYADIWRALRNFRRSGAAWLLTTTFTGPRENVDIVCGDWRPLNFERAPFAFPRPIEVFAEECDEDAGIFADKSLGLWRLADLYDPRLTELP